MHALMYLACNAIARLAGVRVSHDPPGIFVPRWIARRRGALDLVAAAAERGWLVRCRP